MYQARESYHLSSVSYEDHRDLANIICMSLVSHLFLREIISSLVRMFDNLIYSIDYQIRLIKHLDNFSSTSLVFYSPLKNDPLRL